MDYAVMRSRMVNEQLIPRGITDPKVLKSFRSVPRHEFVPQIFRDSAYGDYPLSIGSGQTISQPYMVALMTECLGLKGGEKVLEIGTGSGYQTVILAELAGMVYSVERVGELARKADAIITRLGYTNFMITVGDGTLGWKDHAPYDGIIVTAGAPQVPPSLIDQLSYGGRLVIPVGGRWEQMLKVIFKKGETVSEEDVCPCVFVPLLGEEGWRS